MPLTLKPSFITKLPFKEFKIQQLLKYDKSLRDPTGKLLNKFKCLQHFTAHSPTTTSKSFLYVPFFFIFHLFSCTKLMSMLNKERKNNSLACLWGSKVKITIITLKWLVYKLSMDLYLTCDCIGICVGTHNKFNLI